MRLAFGKPSGMPSDPSGLEIAVKPVSGSHPGAVAAHGKALWKMSSELLGFDTTYCCGTPARYWLTLTPEISSRMRRRWRYTKRPPNVVAPDNWLSKPPTTSSWNCDLVPPATIVWASGPPEEATRPPGM